MQVVLHALGRRETYDKQLSGHVDVVDHAGDGHRSFANGRDVRIRGVRKQDCRLGALHDYLQVDVCLKQIKI